MNDPLYSLSRDIGRLLCRQRHKLTTAESCTGGWVAKCMTDIPGSSGWFDGGFVTYSNASKMALLGVSQATLEGYGAVSAETVQEMVDGALKRSAAEVALAVSGIAGPVGATSDKPVGTVWFAWQRVDQTCKTRRVLLGGGRDAVRKQAVELALNGLLRIYEE